MNMRSHKGSQKSWSLLTLEMSNNGRCAGNSAASTWSATARRPSSWWVRHVFRDACHGKLEVHHDNNFSGHHSPKWVQDQVTPEKVDFLVQELFQKLGVRDLAQSQIVVNMLYDQALRHVDQQPVLAHFAHRLVTHPQSPQVRSFSPVTQSDQ
eukprot:scaffold8228_cov15-Tisochrysis_lutea.AAC.1